MEKIYVECSGVYVYVPHEPTTTVQGRPGMEAVDFLEKTTVAEHFGHLHELFIYDVRGCCRINPFDFTFSDLLPPRMPIWYPCMGSLIQQLCHSLWNDLLSKDYYEEEGLNRKREYLLRFWIKFYKSVKYHIYSSTDSSIHTRDSVTTI